MQVESNRVATEAVEVLWRETRKNAEGVTLHAQPTRMASKEGVATETQVAQVGYGWQEGRGDFLATGLLLHLCFSPSVQNLGNRS